MLNRRVNTRGQPRRVAPLLLPVGLIVIALSSCSRSPEPACCVCACHDAGGRPCAEIRLKAAAGVYCQGLCQDACMSQGCLVERATVVGSGACPGRPAPPL